MKYLLAKAIRVGDMEFVKQKSKFLKAHTSSGYKKAIEELLGNPEFSQQLQAVKAADEVTWHSIMWCSVMLCDVM